jgi:hypothetical protein
MSKQVKSIQCPNGSAVIIELPALPKPGVTSSYMIIGNVSLLRAFFLS